MSEKAEVEAIVANLELEDYFVIHSVEPVIFGGRKVIAIMVEVRDE